MEENKDILVLDQNAVYTVTEASKFLDVASQTIRNWDKLIHKELGLSREKGAVITFNYKELERLSQINKLRKQNKLPIDTVIQAVLSKTDDAVVQLLEDQKNGAAANNRLNQMQERLEQMEEQMVLLTESLEQEKLNAEKQRKRNEELVQTLLKTEQILLSLPTPEETVNQIEKVKVQLIEEQVGHINKVKDELIEEQADYINKVKDELIGEQVDQIEKVKNELTEEQRILISRMERIEKEQEAKPKGFFQKLFGK